MPEGTYLFDPKREPRMAELERRVAALEARDQVLSTALKVQAEVIEALTNGLKSIEGRMGPTEKPKRRGRPRKTPVNAE